MASESWVRRVCGEQGHGPITVVRQRVWWAPWRTRSVVACWVCRTPLDSDAAREAERQWRSTFEWYTTLTGRRLAPKPGGGRRG